MLLPLTKIRNVRYVHNKKLLSVRNLSLPLNCYFSLLSRTCKKYQKNILIDFWYLLFTFFNCSTTCDWCFVLRFNYVACKVSFLLRRCSWSDKKTHGNLIKSRETKINLISFVFCSYRLIFNCSWLFLHPKVFFYFLSALN